MEVFVGVFLERKQEILDSIYPQFIYQFRKQKK